MKGSRRFSDTNYSPCPETSPVMAELMLDFGLLITLKQCEWGCSKKERCIFFSVFLAFPNPEHTNISGI